MLDGRDGCTKSNRRGPCHCEPCSIADKPYDWPESGVNLKLVMQNSTLSNCLVPLTLQCCAKMGILPSIPSLLHVAPWSVLGARSSSRKSLSSTNLPLFDLTVLSACCGQDHGRRPCEVVGMPRVAGLVNGIDVECTRDPSDALHVG